MKSARSNSIFNIFTLFALLASLLGSAIFVTPAYAAGLCYVDINAAGANDGTSWANAYTNPQSTLGTSSCTEVWVAKGTYNPSATIRTTAFVLKNGVGLYGGFAGTETLRSQRNPTLNVTILSGDIGTLNVNSDNSYHVVVSGGAGTGTLDGFTITAGNANTTGGFGSRGGGIIIQFGSSPILVNLIISGNSSYSDGGGMYIDTSNPTLTKISFNNNTTGGWGGGLNIYNSSPSLTNVTFSGNSAILGGGMFNYSSSPRLTNVTFSGNSSSSSGGGMYNYSNSNPTLTNVTFSGNSALGSSEGGGIANSDSSPVLKNVTLSGNSAGGRAGGIRNGGTSNPTLTNVILWGNISPYDPEIFGSATVTYSVVQGGYAGATNISSDPNLGALTNNGGFTQTFSLGAGSSAIDTGANSGCPADDQRGMTRPQGGVCDIGAFEVDMPPIVGIVVADNALKIGDTSLVTFTFSEAVSGFDNTDLAIANGTLSAVSSANGGITWTATFTPTASITDANNIITLDNAGLTDLAGNAGTGSSDSNNYAIDTSAPNITSFTLKTPATSPTNADTLIFLATFSEAVTGVDPADFSVNSITTATNNTVTPVTTSTYEVTISGGDLAGFDGTVNINLSGTPTITDLAGNALSAGEPSTDETYTVENTAPILTLPANMTVEATSPAGAVASFSATATDIVDATPTVACVPPSGSTFPLGASTVNCTATDDAGNVSNGSFTITVVTPAVSLSATNHDFGYQAVGTTSSAFAFTVTNTGTANLVIGTLGITGQFALSNNLCNGQTIAPSGTCTFDAIFSPTSAGAKAGSISIPSNAASSPDAVSLSGSGIAPVVGLSAISIDFGDQLLGATSTAQTVTLTNTGTADLNIGTLSFTSDWILSNDTCSSATVVPAGTCTFDVAFHPLAVGPLTGSITIPSDAASSPDTVSLSGNGYISQILRFRSNGAKDGMVRESTETSGIGNYINSSNQLISVGDDSLKRQYVGILDFDTSSLPNNAIITSAKLQVKVMVISSGVYAKLGNLTADVTNPYFGTSPGLQNMDFGASALANAGIFTRATTFDQWITLKMKAGSLSAVNLLGHTQFRLRFTLDDSNDTIKHQIGFLSGNYSVVTDRPTLIVTYYVP